MRAYVLGSMMLWSALFQTWQASVGWEMGIAILRQIGALPPRRFKHRQYALNLIEAAFKHRPSQFTSLAEPYPLQST